MKKTLVSIIIPCYNVEKYLTECLDSVLNQVFKQYEIICIEDCSKDKTKDILKQYEKKYKNIRVIYNKTNQGLAISRNIGINNSLGEYVYFLDSDDYISKNCIDKLYKKIVTDNCDMVMAAIKPYPEDKQNEFCITRSDFLQGWVKFEHFTKLKITEKNGCEYYEKLYCCAVNKLYKKSFLIDNSIYFINKKCFHEDNGFWLKILACKPIISGIFEQTYFYRIRNQSITNKMDLDKKTHVQHVELVLKDALDFVKNKKNKNLYNFIYHIVYNNKKNKLKKIVLRILCLFVPIRSWRHKIKNYFN